ncbi:MAG: 50S ribosomal protein L25 [Bacteroidota bacterium]
MAEITLNANERSISRKSANKQLRRDGSVPGVYYGKNIQPVAVSVLEQSLKPLVYTSEAHIVSLVVDGKEPVSCILKDIQFDPVTDKIVHFDLQGISSDEKLEVEIPILLEGNPEGIKQGGVMQQSLHKLDISCLPMFMPEHLVVNVSKLAMGESIHVADLKFDNIEILTAEDAVIVSIVTPRAEKETAAEGEAQKEPEVISKGKVDKE